MAKKIPIGIQDFRELVKGGYYYVDKTKQIYNLITSNKYYFLSRPRRFGKSLTLSVMKYLYMGKKELFSNTWIYDKWNWDETYPVLYMSFAGYTADQDIREYINKSFKVYINDQEYGIDEYDNRYELDYILQKIYTQTGKQTAIIIDEYDKGVLAHLSNVIKAEEMRAFFTSFYAGVKDSDPYIKLFMLTGLTKVLKMSVFSVLNNLRDVSYMKDGYAVMGYTQEELMDNFEEEILELEKIHNLDRVGVLEKIKINYNGYNFGKEDDTIYNPWNINNLIINKEFSFYWADTGIPSAILNYIQANKIDTKEFVERVNAGIMKVGEVDFKLEDLRNVNVSVLFANSGYLTIKTYENNLYELGYPNRETENVMNNFFLKFTIPKADTAIIEMISNGIYEGFVKQDKEILEEAFDLMLNNFLVDTAYEWTNRNPEGWFKTFLGLFLRVNNINYYPEVQNLKGRKDFVIPLQDKYYIIEAKVDKTTREAIEQIDKKYIPQFEILGNGKYQFKGKDPIFNEVGKNIIKVGLNWNRQDNMIEVEFI